MTPSDIVARVAAARGVSISNLRGHRRYASWARARQEIYWLLRRHTAMSFPQIGALLVGRDHATIMSGEDVIEALVERDPDYGRELERLAAGETFAAALRAA